MEIGEYRLLKAGTKVWSIALQETVSFEKDQVVKITNTLIGYPDSFFGKIQILFGQHFGTVPGNCDKNNGDIGPLDIKNTEPYTLKTIKDTMLTCHYGTKE